MGWDRGYGASSFPGRLRGVNGMGMPEYLCITCTSVLLPQLQTSSMHSILNTVHVQFMSLRNRKKRLLYNVTVIPFL